jgi:hypothetical protein
MTWLLTGASNLDGEQQTFLHQFEISDLYCVSPRPPIAQFSVKIHSMTVQRDLSLSSMRHEHIISTASCRIGVSMALMRID